MKTLSEHFIEIISRVKIPQQSIDLTHLKIMELNNKELNKIFQKVWHLVDADDLIKCEDVISEFTLGNKIYKVCVRQIKYNKNSSEYYIINFYSPDVECIILQIELNEKKAYLIELLKQNVMQLKNSKYENMPKETGELLLKIVIKVCNKFGIDDIYLTDNSYV